MIFPTRGYVLVEPEKAEQKTASGLYLPDNAQEKPQKGVVIEVGEALTNRGGAPIPKPAAIGERVYYKRWGGEEIQEDGKEYKLVKFEDILAVIR